MKLTDLLYVPQLDLGAWAGTVKRGRILLPPSHLMFGRFDLLGIPVGYFAESPETAAFESLFRREAGSVSVAVLAKRSLLCVQSTHSLRLLDLRPHTQSWPVLQSLRFAHTQALAAETSARDLQASSTGPPSNTAWIATRCLLMPWIAESLVA